MTDPATLRYVSPYGVMSDIEIPAEAAERIYPHGAECRERDTTPAWEVESLDPLVLVRRCSGRSCGLAQHWELPPPPAPPRPDVSAFEADHGRVHTEVTMEVASGDRLAAWLARCTACGATCWFRREATEWYQAHDARIGDRVVSGTLDDLAPLPDPERDAELAQAERIGTELAHVVVAKAGADALAARLRR